MQTFLVGGAVRDQLLGRPVTERDWVVVGATPEQMIAKGFKQVGKDFPVFLHPESREEYALARTERKNGVGYTGFSCDSSPHVSLVQDLKRRDLTVNAMAMDEQGRLIDPFEGKKDLQNKVLRHVSAAFVEDPLRVLRVARFAARYHALGFNICAETLALMSNIVNAKELQSLSPERVWKETSRALLEAHPEVFFGTLKACGALVVWFAELDKLWGVPNPPNWHPEVDTGVHSMMVLTQAVKRSSQLSVRFAALVHDLGKALTPPEHWPSHRGHEKLGLSPINRLCDRLKVPNECRELALLVSEYHSHIHRALELKPATLLKVLNQCDAWRREARFHQFLLTCQADAAGRKGFEQAPYPQADYVRNAFRAAKAVNVENILAAGHQGRAIKTALDQQRTSAILSVKQAYESQSLIK